MALERIARILPYILCLPVTLTSSIDALARELNGFDLKGSLVPEGEIMRGGPPRDGIAAVHNPKFISSGEAMKLYPKRTRALVVRAQDDVKAYPIPVLNWHEIVNDKIGKTAIAVTYCPLCGTGIVFKASVGSDVLRFGVSGLLYQSDVLLYDKQTESLWSQLLRKAVTGKYKGRTLEIYSSTVEILDDVVKKEPKVRVLSTDTGFRRDYARDPYSSYDRSPVLYFPVNHRDNKAPLKAWSLLLDTGTDSLIVPLPFLDAARRDLEVRVGGTRISIQYDRERNLLNCKGQVGSVTCVSGYYFALRTFYPEAKVYSPKSETKKAASQ